MEILHVNHEKFVEKKEEILPQILDKIFLICKEDSSFTVNDELHKYDSIIESTNSKLIKKKDLLEQSKEIEGKLLEELQTLDERIFSKTSNLLESLGSNI